MTHREIIDFVIESNEIERISRAISKAEIDEFRRFIALDVITIAELKRFLAIYQPEAELRDKYDMNVVVGNYIAPFGGSEIVANLESLLSADYNAYDLHIAYEKLHPFTDGNGRSGRALWAWKMKEFRGSFLLNFYFQTLEKHGEKKNAPNYRQGYN
jgi:hypothetical protein